VSGAPSCTKCGNLLAVQSASGMCPACAPAGEPGTFTFSAAASPSPDTPNAAADPTPASAAAPDPHAPTHTAPDAAVTASASAPTAPATADKPLPPDPSGYALLARLGEGGMGEVFRAVEYSTDKEVALKMMNAKTSATAFARLQQEFRALSKFEHEHAVRVFKDRFDHDPPFFTMELLAGTVGKHLERIGRYEPRAAVELIRKVARAVQAMHDLEDFGCPNGLVHRDIKPSNILLTKGNEPKLADFGLVKFLDAATLTPTDAALGTPAYMPPEQCGGAPGELDYRADVYGLGATLYALLTGRPPFRGTAVEIIARLPTEEPPPVRALAPEVDATLSNIVRACMYKRPEDRYQTVRALIAHLDDWLAEKPVLPPRVSRPTRLWRWAQRNAVALTACALLALGGGLLGRAMGWDRVIAEYWHSVPQEPERGPDPVVVQPFVPELTHEQVVNDLRAGKKVELIGAKGPRVPVHWALGPCEMLVPPHSGSAGLVLKSNGRSFLTLLPDPGIDRYRLRLVVAQDRWIPAAPGGVTDSAVGAFFGYRRFDLPTGETAHALLTVGYCEPTPGAHNGGVRHWDFWFVERPLREHGRFNHSAGSVPLASLETVPGKRTIEIDIGPNEVTLFHDSKRHARAPHKLHRDWHELENGLNDTIRPNRVELGKWSVRHPVGVWVQESWVSIHSFSIEPQQP
jgi:eukaryotic-like serine/threonine-protein kinase